MPHLIKWLFKVDAWCLLIAGSLLILGRLAIGHDTGFIDQLLFYSQGALILVTSYALFSAITSTGIKYEFITLILLLILLADFGVMAIGGFEEGTSDAPGIWIILGFMACLNIYIAFLHARHLVNNESEGVK